MAAARESQILVIADLRNDGADKASQAAFAVTFLSGSGHLSSLLSNNAPDSIREFIRLKRLRNDARMFVPIRNCRSISAQNNEGDTFLGQVVGNRCRAFLPLGSGQHRCVKLLFRDQLQRALKRESWPDH